MPVRSKICGNRSADDVDAVVSAGAHALGVIVGARYVTEDEVSVDGAKALLERVPPFLQRVLVTHLVDADELLDVLRVLPVQVVQLHDAIPLEGIERLRHARPDLQLMKAVHVTGPDSLAAAQQFARHVDALLLDSRTEDRVGGTGQTHDWSLSRRIVEAVERPVILAGGLGPHNVERAIAEVRPHAVDVNSGVERPDGSKDPEKVRAFVRLAFGASE